jgi:undecaprenyl diphosphate synthase
METGHTHSIKCVGFIMDGNRRWARARGLSPVEGHEAGFRVLEDIVQVVHRAHIPHLVCYAFSTENWKRDGREVAYLMELFQEQLKRMHDATNEDRMRIRVVGRMSDFTEDIQLSVAELVAKTERYTNETTIWIALSYGGRAEIIDAANRAIALGEKVDEDSFSQLLYTKGMPDPDLIIRTGGEKRLSNFLPWQGVYSELFFTETLWPDFGEAEFQSILEAYGTRERRRGT